MDKERAKAFMSLMIGTLNAGSIAMMISIGHRTGLFDAMAPLGAVTSVELADAAGLNERYVREWLAAMASAEIVDYDPDAETFLLPVEHQTLVTRAGGSLNLASMMQTISHLGSVEDDVVEAFKTGEGVPYSKYPKFSEWMAQDSAARFDACLLDQVIPAIPGAQDLLEDGISLADVGCGSGHALLILAEAFPASSFVGIDFSQEVLDVGAKRANERGLDNVEFIALDAAEIDMPEAFDIVMSFDAIHDQAHPDRVLSNIERALRPDGTYVCAEPKAHTALADNMAEPAAAYQYTMSTMHCMSVSLAGGGIGLGTAWGKELATEYLKAAGFSSVDTLEVRSDRTNTYFMCHKS